MTTSSEKVVLITGASSGLGRATAELLKEKGYMVFGTSRSPTKFKDCKFEFLELDIDSDESVKSCANDLIRRTEKIDVLISNTGSGLLGAIEEVTVGQAREFFNTNFFGTLRIVREVLPHMRRQGEGRIIVMSSGAVAVPSPINALYAFVKSALEAYCEGLRFEVASMNIKVSLVEPSYFKTSFGNSIKFPSESIDAYQKNKGNAMNAMQERASKGGDPKMVAQFISRLIENPPPELHNFIAMREDLPRVVAAKQQYKIEPMMRKYWNLN